MEPFMIGRAPHHGAPIEPERLTVLDWRPAPVSTRWSDPFFRRNHSDCIRRMQLPLSRRLLNAADEKVRQRFPDKGYDADRFRSVLAELSRLSERPSSIRRQL